MEFLATQLSFDTVSTNEDKLRFLDIYISLSPTPFSYRWGPREGGEGPKHSARFVCRTGQLCPWVSICWVCHAQPSDTYFIPPYQTIHHTQPRSVCSNRETKTLSALFRTFTTHVKSSKNRPATLWVAWMHGGIALQFHSHRFHLLYKLIKLPQKKCLTAVCQIFFLAERRHTVYMPWLPCLISPPSPRLYFVSKIKNSKRPSAE